MPARPSVLMLTVAPAALLLAACSSSGSSTGGGGGEPRGTYSTAAHTSFTMPDLLGQKLPAAEAAVQKAARNALFQIRAEDATAAGRTPSPATGWKVCRQDVPAGTETDQTATLTLGVVRAGEDCPR